MTQGQKCMLLQISELSKKDVDNMLIRLYGFCDKLHEIIIEARK